MPEFVGCMQNSVGKTRVRDSRAGGEERRARTRPQESGAESTYAATGVRSGRGSWSRLFALEDLPMNTGILQANS